MRQILELSSTHLLYIGMLLLFAALYAVSVFINSCKRKKLAREGIDYYSDEEVREHEGQRRVFVLNNAAGMPRLRREKVHAEFGALVMVAGGRKFKNLFIALSLFLPLALLGYLRIFSGYSIELYEESPMYFYLAIAILVLYALYRLYIGTSKMELYQYGMVTGPVCMKKQYHYDNIAQMDGYEYMKRFARGNRAGYRRAWACRIILKDGRAIEFNDSRYYRARYRLGRWMDSLTWEESAVSAE